eukprot:CAMPEP_0117549644 /NCGR_PEP_ID=MMETSP0784-20121206/48271_1 /TAXON_ID=39447 /ORGANISM="" /LENGTH=52 /DNA_ID=CAMNT_0005346637 /DNA_START=122 /DNA_END=280 /DNA_ORIENTATION=+
MDMPKPFELGRRAEAAAAFSATRSMHREGERKPQQKRETSRSRRARSPQRMN